MTDLELLDAQTGYDINKFYEREQALNYCFVHNIPTYCIRQNELDYMYYVEPLINECIPKFKSKVFTARQKEHTNINVAYIIRNDTKYFYTNRKHDSWSLNLQEACIYTNLNYVKNTVINHIALDNFHLLIYKVFVIDGVITCEQL